MRDKWCVKRDNSRHRPFVTDHVSARVRTVTVRGDPAEKARKTAEAEAFSKLRFPARLI